MAKCCRIRPSSHSIWQPFSIWQEECCQKDMGQEHLAKCHDTSHRRRSAPAAHLSDCRRCLPMAANASDRSAPCCPRRTLEPSRVGRCHAMAAQGKCRLRRDLCPVACGTCQVCPGHGDFDLYATFHKTHGGPLIVARAPLDIASSVLTRKLGTALLDRLHQKIKRCQASSGCVEQQYKGSNGTSACAHRLTAERHLVGGESTQSLVLIGVLSANPARRRLLRCTWLCLSLPSIRTLFVVGRDAQRGGGSGGDVLVVNVSEARARSYQDRNRSSVTGSWTAYFKLVAFLRHAATQPEPLAVRADDDVFVSPRMLHAYAKWVLDHLEPTRRRLFGGVFEWHSWRPRSLLATGFGYSWTMAETNARKAWRNCSTALLGVDDGARRDTCQGAFPFAKGPFLLLSRAAILWLLASVRFERDVGRAMTLSQARLAARAAAAGAPRRGLRVDDDIQLGYWMSHAPSLTYVRLRRSVVSQSIGRSIQPEAALLAAHKLAWQSYAPLGTLVQRAWSAARQRVRVRSVCVDEPPCAGCPRGDGQSTCIAEAQLEFARGRPALPPCIAQPQAAGCPAFKDGSAPTGAATMCVQ